MAEQTQSPALPSTADTTPYVPVSWMAVAAISVAATFAGLLLVFGIAAFTNKKPLLMQELLVLPVIAVVLSFAARRMIRNSEGTRTGEQLAVTAWWSSLVLGLGYVAYLFAIDYSVRRDAASEVERWVALVQEGEEKSGSAFYQTLHPGMRQGISKSDLPGMKLRFRDELLMFGSMDLMKLAQRNKGECDFVPGGVSDWSYKPGTIDCMFAGTVKCPEGNFPVMVSLKGFEGVTTSEGGGGGRQWMIVRPQSGGFIQQDKAERTTYGWLVLMLEMGGGGFGKAFVDQSALGSGARPYLHHAFVAEGGDPAGWIAAARNPFMQMTFAIPLGVTAAAKGGGYAQYLADHFYKLPGGGDPTPGQRDKFVASWNALGLLEAGKRLKDPAGNVPDKEPVIKITDSVVEVHLPVELPILSSAGKLETARGRLVVACKDPTLLAEIKAQKAAAKGEKPSNSPPEELGRKAAVHWRVVRIESDLHPVQMAQPGGPGGGPGGPGGGPGGMPGGGG